MEPTEYNNKQLSIYFHTQGRDRNNEKLVNFELEKNLQVFPKLLWTFSIRMDIKSGALVATMEEEGGSGKLSDQSEILLRINCSLAITNSESFLGSCSTIIDALSLVYSLYCILSILAFANNYINKNSCSSIWVEVQFSFLHNGAEVCHNQALRKELHWTCSMNITSSIY